MSWTEPAYNGGSSLHGFRIMLKQKDEAFSEELVYCDGADQTTKANLFCLIPSQVLRDEPYWLVTGDEVVATVEAFNIIGYSDPSSDSIVNADIRTQPFAPAIAPSRVDELTSETSITVEVSNYDSAPENGGSPILSLSIWWDQGVSNWVPIVGEYTYSLELQHTVSLLTPGASYRFKYRAINAFGYGDFSAETAVIAASIPEKISLASTVSDGTNVVISWTKPDSRGSTIDSY